MLYDDDDDQEQQQLGKYNEKQVEPATMCDTC